MTNLEPRADRVVRDAVDAFMEGRLVPEFSGETVFETKNSRYRLRDGVVFAAPDPSLLGAELVGWLCESSRRCLVESAWQTGSRAVLVDRTRGRHIIVTSTTRLLHLEEHGASTYGAGLAASQADFRSWHPPSLDGSHEARSPFSPQQAPIIASTPAPPSARLTPPPPLVLEAPPPEPIITEPSPVPPAVYAPAKRGVHLPPRPIARGQAVLRPLPVPVPPPRRGVPSPEPSPAPVIVPTPPVMPAGIEPIVEPPAWEITSAEMEIVEIADAEPSGVDAAPAPDDPSQDETMIPFELARPRTTASEPVHAEPFPLVYPIDRPDGSGTR